MIQHPAPCTVDDAWATASNILADALNGDAEYDRLVALAVNHALRLQRRAA